MLFYPGSLISFLTQGTGKAGGLFSPSVPRTIAHTQQGLGQCGVDFQTQRVAFTIKDSGYVAKESKTRIQAAGDKGGAESLCKMGNISASILSEDCKD